jgi:hypothetical protein
MFRVYCPHCLAMVQQDDADGEAAALCPVCKGALDAVGVPAATFPDYEVKGAAEPAQQNKDVQEYVQSLEKRARKERKKKPYNRKRFPVDLVAGIILIGIGCMLLLFAFSGEGGMMSALVNYILPASILFMIGAICIRFWAD